MGAVYAAFDEKLERDVALKVLLEEEDLDLALQKKRLLREARLAAKLQHPNIATVYEVDEIDDRLVIVMELLEGSSLRRILMKRKMDQDEVVSVARDMARALARAHAAGVIHRDIKPENVFVTTPSPDTLLAKVLDFGLARQKPPSTAPAHLRTEESTSTSRGDLWGTPGYVSPEQAHGHSVDVRTDIFSFGVVLYEMLANIKPFRGETPIAVILATVKQEPRPLKDIVKDLPSELDAIVRKCMMKDRDARFQDGAELSAALEGWVRNNPQSTKIANVIGTGSRPSLPLVTLDLAAAAGASDLRTSDLLVDDEAPTTGNAAIIEMPAAPQPQPPPLEQQRVDHMKLVAAIGSGVAFALVVVIAVLSWARPSSRKDPHLVTSSHEPPPAQSITDVAPPIEIDPPRAPASTAVSEEPPTVDIEDVSPATSASTPSPVATPHRTVGVKKDPKTKANDCAQPFTVDAKGVRIPKLHCL